MYRERLLYRYKIDYVAYLLLSCMYIYLRQGDASYEEDLDFHPNPISYASLPRILLER